MLGGMPDGRNVGAEDGKIQLPCERNRTPGAIALVLDLADAFERGQPSNSVGLGNTLQLSRKILRLAVPLPLSISGDAAV